MAYNNWDKLAKAQSDNPNPKFAIGVADKGLKKTPNNPFLLTWKADLSLQLNKDLDYVSTRLHGVCSQPGLSDTRLLSYLYRICAETCRRSEPWTTRNTNTIGNEWLKPWQNAAKALGRKDDRLNLWSMLFKTAMREDCWEDARFAAVNYHKEGPPLKKLAHYTRILAIHLAAEQKQRASNQNAQMSQIQFSVARKQLQQAWEAAPDDPIAVKDIRDLRFMAEIYGRQNRCKELFALWDNPPASLKGVMKTYRDDLRSLKTRLLKRQKDWELLETHCLYVIDDTLMQLNLVQDSKSLWELCAWNWDIWGSLLQATKALYPKEKAIEKISNLLDRCFGAGCQAKDRPVRLTYMLLRQFTGVSMLSDCKEYWECHSGTPSCFADLRPFIERLSLEEIKNFRKFIRDRTMSCKDKSDIDQVAFEQWQEAELNALKFDYLLEISRAQEPTHHALETLITKAIRFCITCPKRSDGGFLAIYALLRLHHQVICQEDDITLHHEAICKEDGKVPFEVTPNSRILLQAAMLARHLVARDKNKENRTLSLLAARLHLNLGLGKCAFQLYSHAKCKEMLLDTLSPYILSRISSTHPFGITGYQGFSADEELAKVISTIERMEIKTDGYIYADMPSFVWDQVPDALDFKRKLKASLTKHICIMERRRIARLKGESVENIPCLKIKSYYDTSNNLDRSVFPNYEHTDSVSPLDFVMPAGIPDMEWMIKSHAGWEDASRILYREGTFFDYEEWDLATNINPTPVFSTLSNKTRAEVHLTELWGRITGYTVDVLHPYLVEEQYSGLPRILDQILQMRLGMEKLRMPGSTTLKPEDEPTMFHENMLMSCYTKLEVLRAMNKYIELLQKEVFTPKSSHPMKTKIPKDLIDALMSETQICYVAVRDVAQSYITLIKKRGEAAIKAQVRWGKTGEQLSQLLDDGDVEYYANEYVESALEAWKGVLKVKLK